MEVSTCFAVLDIETETLSLVLLKHLRHEKGNGGEVKVVAEMPGYASIATAGTCLGPIPGEQAEVVADSTELAALPD